MAKILKVDGTQIEVQPKNGTDFKLDEMKEVVGGWIEIVRLDNGQLLIVNDEGHCLGLPWNTAATELYRHSPIAGNALLCESHQVR